MHTYVSLMLVEIFFLTWMCFWQMCNACSIYAEYRSGMTSIHDHPISMVRHSLVLYYVVGRRAGSLLLRKRDIAALCLSTPTSRNRWICWESQMYCWGAIIDTERMIWHRTRMHTVCAHVANDLYQTDYSWKMVLVLSRFVLMPLLCLAFVAFRVPNANPRRFWNLTKFSWCVIAVGSHLNTKFAAQNFRRVAFAFVLHPNFNGMGNPALEGLKKLKSYLPFSVRLQHIWERSFSCS